MEPEKIENSLKDKYTHYSVDIRNNDDVEEIFKKHKFDVIINILQLNLRMTGRLKNLLLTSL